MIKAVNTRSGFGLVEELVVVGVVSVIGLGVNGILTGAFKTQKKVSMHSNIDSMREAILNNLQNDVAFTNTLKNPANAAVFNCLNTASDCRSMGGEFKIFDKNNQALGLTSFSTEPSAGFDETGNACASFSSSQGDDSCPFKYVAVWAAECYQSQNIQNKASVETACREPLIKVTVTFSYMFEDSTKVGTINPNKMKVAVVKSQNDSALAGQSTDGLRNMCQTMLNGAFNPNSATCILPTANFMSCENSCPGYQSVVTGFNDDGTPKCTCTITGPTFTSCNAPGENGRVALGINDDGSLICSPGIIPMLIANGNFNNPPIVFNAPPQPPAPPAPPPPFIDPALVVPPPFVDPAAAGGGDGGGGADGGGGGV